MQPQRIVILSPAHPLRGGIASLSERLAQELQERGHDVVIYSFSLQYPNFLFPGKTQYTDDPPPEGLKILTKVNSVNPVNWRKVGREIARLRPDVLIARYWLPFMGPSLGTILRQAKKNMHTRTLAIVDNIVPHEKRPGDRQLTSYFVKAVDGFLVMSKSVREDLQQFTANTNVRLQPHPLYDNYGVKVSKKEALEYLNLPTSNKYLLFFGFIRDYKGLDLLLEAMSDERIRAMDVKLIVAGEFYGNGEKYKQQIQQLQIENQLILRTKFIPKEEVKYYFAAADLVVQPYKSATQSGISQLAYHFERPMVVTRVGGLSEIVPHGEAGYVVEVQPQAIADAIVDFFNQEKSQILTAGVIKNKQRFSWPAFAETLENLIIDVQNI